MIDWKNIINYDPTSPTFLRWKINTGPATNGKPAGCFKYRKNGDKSAVRVQYEGRAYMAHHIVYLLTKGPMLDNMIIDHIDGNPFNNCIENLELKSLADNARNLKLDKRNVSGYAGISVKYSNNGRNKNYLVSACFEERKFKSFAVKKYGEELALELAIKTRDSMIEELKKQGRNYTERNRNAQ